MRSSRALDHHSGTAGGFLVFVNPTTTQKPMNSTSTNTVLAPSPWSGANRDLQCVAAHSAASGAGRGGTS
jgi:hypothetical protein